jgi:homoserine kinase type II
VFFDGETFSGVIDFYFACHDFWMYDLAIVLNAWCFDATHAYASARAEALFAGYRKVRPIGEDEWHALPVLARGAALRFLLTRTHDWVFHDAGAVVTPKDPLEYLAKLDYWQSIDNFSV